MNDEGSYCGWVRVNELQSYREAAKAPEEGRPVRSHAWEPIIFKVEFCYNKILPMFPLLFVKMCAKYLFFSLSLGISHENKNNCKQKQS